jgi:hypothetical protein
MAAAVHGKMTPVDANHPPDTPIMLGNAPGTASDARTLPVEVQRELEASLHAAEKLSLQCDAYRTAEHDATVALGMQAMWLSCGLLLARRGYKFADPIRSLAKPYTDNMMICKLANPLTIIGSIMGGVTAYQIPHDLRFWKEARQAVVMESVQLHAASEARKQKLIALGIGVPPTPGGHPAGAVVPSSSS